uniref:Uncharacterized protein n=1 Tax=Octopus bimaculoides TaxID=37653 RepID=A0A0L8FIT5_OCTBM
MKICICTSHTCFITSAHLLYYKISHLYNFVFFILMMLLFKLFYTSQDSLMPELFSFSFLFCKLVFNFCSVQVDLCNVAWGSHGLFLPV